MARSFTDRLRRWSGTHAKACAFCGGLRPGDRSLTGSRRSKICAGCVQECQTRLAEAPMANPPLRRTVWLAQMYCSFCGHSPAPNRELVPGPRVWICSECLTKYHSELIAPRTSP
ncbi:ClpX C4-type zinc finger protein [Streptomyces sp. ITFR-16]|uniref:ClpX C4-type zinc finger protein n=1 Tax=Streptomyces sp. ITFR-16 TaxID=3075198 RepID=UPI0037DA2A1E